MRLDAHISPMEGTLAMLFVNIECLKSQTKLGKGSQLMQVLQL